jgi:tetratricopeptide (TPR) repeat protein
MRIRILVVLTLAALFNVTGCSTGLGGGPGPSSSAGDTEVLALVDAARQDYEAGRYSAARQKLERVLERVPRNVGMHTRAANAAYREGRYEIAAFHYTEALRYSEEPLPRVRYNLAMVRLSQAGAELNYLQDTEDGTVIRSELGDLLEALERHTGRVAPSGIGTDADGANGD